jgi:hypothetical protein
MRSSDEYLRHPASFMDEGARLDCRSTAANYGNPFAFELRKIRHNGRVLQQRRLQML